MGCKGCSDKESRYGGKKVTQGDIDRGTVPPQLSPSDPMSAFFSAKSMSYDELKERQRFSKKAAKQQSEHLMSEMSEPMKRIHLEELLDTAGLKEMSIPNMTTEMAIKTIKELLDRDDFKFTDSLYPGLKKEIGFRYTKIMSSRFIMPK